LRCDPQIFTVKNPKFRVYSKEIGQDW